MATARTHTQTPESGASGLELYKYAQLPRNSWIRVAAVRPYTDHVNEILHFEFEDVHIADAGHQNYIALSYAWGSQEPSEPLICKGKQLTITQNLLSALRNLRRSDEIVYIWADAICIDQTSSEERKQQVSMMDRVFAEASAVVVYLGEFSAQHLACAATIKTFAEAGFSEHDVSHMRSMGEIHTYFREAFKDMALPELGDPFWSSLRDLVSRSWFKRLWIVQEYAVAQKVSFITGNNSFLEADVFVMGMAQALWYHRILAVPIYEKLTFKGFTAAETIALWLPRFSFRKGYYLPIFEMQSMLAGARLLEWGGNQFAHISSFRLGYQKNQSKTQLHHRPGRDCLGLGTSWRGIFGQPWWVAQKHMYFQIFARTRRFAATDARDRVYALRGLCAEQSIPELEVDYDSPTWQVAERISAHLIRRGHGVHLLTTLSLSTRGRMHGWRVLLRQSEVVAVEQLCRLVNQGGGFENNLFRAGGYEEQIQVLSDGREKRASIAVPGVEIGRLTNVCTVELPDLVAKLVQGKEDGQYTSWLEGMKAQVKWYLDAVEWLRSIESWIQSTGSVQPSFELECWRSLCCGITFDAKGRRELIGSKPGQFDPGVAIMHCKEAYSSLWSLFWRFMNRNVALPWDHIVISSNLQLAVDSIGRICTVPIGSEPDDCVCLFKGFPLPFVLRPIPDGTYQLLGAAYVQGVMDGDLFEDMHRKHLRTFVLDPGPTSDDP